MTIELLADIEAKIDTDATDEWLDEKGDEIYDIIKDFIRNEAHFHDALDALLRLMPTLSQREDLRRWGKLFEQAYERTPYAQYNGLDGENAAELKMFIMQKRAKIPQLPTKTVRRKRVLVHPTQMFEMYLILFVARYYTRVEAISNDMIVSLLRMARSVGDVYCMAKLKQALTLIYNFKHEHELAISHGHTSYSHWLRHNNHQEAGITAYWLGVAYAALRELDNAQEWYTKSAEHLAKTGYRKQYASVSMATLNLKLHREEYDIALQWADITLREYQILNDQGGYAVALHSRAIARAFVGDPNEALEDAKEAHTIFKQRNHAFHQYYTEFTIAFITALLGQKKQAMRMLKDLTGRLEKYPDKGFRELALSRSQELMERIESGADLKTPSS